MDVVQFLRSNSDLFAELVAANDISGIVEIANNKTIDRTNSTLRGPILIENAIGTEGAAALEYFLDMAGREDSPQGVYIRNRGNIFVQEGLDLSDPRLQGMIDQFVAQGLPTELGAAIKGLGQWQESLWETVSGRGEILAKEQVETAVISINRQSLYQHQAERYNALVTAIDAGEVNSDEQAAEFFAGK